MSHLSLHWQVSQLSSWSRSRFKRLFDCACVLLALPLLVPVLLAFAVAVRLTSSGPVFFLQERVGRHGRTFTILKFRTLVHSTSRARHSVTTTENQEFTPVGFFLRRWKLDELPQLLNVLFGDMSLVGPRPKMLEHSIFDLPCRPGITGVATIAFAHEEVVLAEVPKDYLETYNYTVVLPAKHRLDMEYMASATFLSDLKLLVNTILFRSDSSALKALLQADTVEVRDRTRFTERSATHFLADTSSAVPEPPRVNQPTLEDEHPA